MPDVAERQASGTIQPFNDHPTKLPGIHFVSIAVIWRYSELIRNISQNWLNSGIKRDAFVK